MSIVSAVERLVAFTLGIKSPAKLLSTAFNAAVFLSFGIFFAITLAL